MTMFVDNILMVSNYMDMVAATKGWRISNFGMKDMGDASYVLRVKIHKDRSKRVLGPSQETYLKNVIERFKMHNLKFILTPSGKEPLP